MLKIEIVPDRQLVIQAGGSLKEIVAELGVVAGDIYSGLKRSQPEAAECFKSAMQHVMRDGAPTWTGTMMAGGTYIVMPQE